MPTGSKTKQSSHGINHQEQTHCCQEQSHSQDWRSRLFVRVPLSMPVYFFSFPWVRWRGEGRGYKTGFSKKCNNGNPTHPQMAYSNTEHFSSSSQRRLHLPSIKTNLSFFSSIWYQARCIILTLGVCDIEKKFSIFFGIFFDYDK